jgi:hypothetical protein
VTEQAPLDPVELDEHEAIRWQRLLDAAGLAVADDDGLRCDGCRHYLTPGDPLAYCWHPGLRIVVDAAWRCRHHAPAPEHLA